MSKKPEVEMVRKGRSWKERLDVPMTQEEKAAMGPRIDFARKEVKALEDQIGALKATYKAKIELADGVVDQLCSQATRGTKEVDVEVNEVFVERNGTVEVWRTDTGEKLRERPMTADEMQPSIPGLEEEPEPAFSGEFKPSTDDSSENAEQDDGVHYEADPDAAASGDPESQVPARKGGRPKGSKNKS
jgi:hypothetical protein